MGMSAEATEKKIGTSGLPGGGKFICVFGVAFSQEFIYIIVVFLLGEIECV
jgi:hypothetical protein